MTATIAPIDMGGFVTRTADGRGMQFELAHPRLAHAPRDLAGLALAPSEPTWGTSQR